MPKFSGEKSGKYDFVAFNPPDSRIYGSLRVDHPGYICLYQFNNREKQTYEKAKITGAGIS
jgi:hypothetical protein